MSVQPQNLESQFDLDEMFFSTTDSRGVIESFNDVFERVSGFYQEELYKRPHNIIRHPDMPKAVFKLLWSVISENRSLCAYVKNMSKDGKFYWVLAMVFPLKDGYLSIRLKPSSDLLGAVSKVYAKMREVERHSDISKVEAVLTEALTSLGFSSYEKFMQVLLVEELITRDRLLAARGEKSEKFQVPYGTKYESILGRSSKCFRESETMFEAVMQLAGTGSRIGEITARMEAIGHGVKSFTTNLGISSGRLGRQGEVLSVVSGGFGGLAEEIRESTIPLKKSLITFNEGLTDLKFLAATSRFQIEMLYAFVCGLAKKGDSCSERETADFKVNSNALLSLVAANISRIDEHLKVFKINFASLGQSISQLMMVITGLDVIRTSGKIEIAKINDSAKELATHVETMAALTSQFKNSLKQLELECQNSLVRIEAVTDGAAAIGREISSF